MLDFLPLRLKNQIISSFKQLYEVRIRQDNPTTVKGSNGDGLKEVEIDFRMTKKQIEEVVFALSNYSIYTVEQSLKQGFITSSSGERVGVCGDAVVEKGEIVTFKNFTSLCIRFPNQVVGCSKPFTDNVDDVKTCLVISPPFHGKTTFIRDLGRVYSDKFNKNVLYVDERDELWANGKFYLGKRADVIRNATKSFAFNFGVRSYNPDVIICDELMTEEDCKGVSFALLSGVKVVASAHSNSLENLLKKQELSRILKNITFENVILIEDFKIKKIYGEKDWLNCFSP